MGAVFRGRGFDIPPGVGSVRVEVEKKLGPFSPILEKA